MTTEEKYSGLIFLKNMEPETISASFTKPGLIKMMIGKESDNKWG